jgi:hypothetical protein
VIRDLRVLKLLDIRHSLRMRSTGPVSRQLGLRIDLNFVKLPMSTRVWRIPKSVKLVALLQLLCSALGGKPGALFLVGGVSGLARELRSLIERVRGGHGRKVILVVGLFGRTRRLALRRWQAHREFGVWCLMLRRGERKLELGKEGTATHDS